MRKKILATTIFTVFSMGLLLLPFLAAQVQAADKIGWVGPVYKELSVTKNYPPVLTRVSRNTIKRPMARTWTSRSCGRVDGRFA
jgi:hypothetical protein